MANDHRRVQVLRISVRPFGPPHVRRGDRQVFDIQIFNVGNEYAAHIEMIDRDIEKSLNLVGMQVHGHDPVDAGGAQQIGNQFGSDRNPRTVLAILPRPTEIGHHGDHPVRRRPVRRIDHQQQFHQIVCRREGRLHDKNGASPDAFVKRGLEFAVAELQNLGIAQIDPEIRSDLLGHVTGTTA